MGAGQNAFAARCSMTTESLPPEKSMIGEVNVARDLTNDVNRLRLERLQLGQRPQLISCHRKSLSTIAESSAFDIWTAVSRSTLAVSTTSSACVGTS